MKVIDSLLWKPVQCGSYEKCCCEESGDMMETFENHQEFARCIKVHSKDDILSAIVSSFDNFFEVILN